MRKKLNVLFAIAIIALIGFSSCDKLANETGDPDGPSLAFIKNDSLVYDDDTVPLNVPYAIAVEGHSSVTTGKDLDYLTIKTTLEDGSSSDTTYADINDIYYFKVHLFIPLKNETVTHTFTLVDKAGEDASITIRITHKGDEINVLSFPPVEIAALEGDTLPSFYDIDSITGYTIDEAVNHQTGIDFGYFKTDALGSSIACPASNNLNEFYSLTDNGWTHFNNVVFAPSDLTTAEFDAITYHYDWQDFTETQNEVNNLNVGDILIFKTEINSGFIKVVDIYDNPDRIVVNIKARMY
jgi:hypothetical protein